MREIYPTVRHSINCFFGGAFMSKVLNDLHHEDSEISDYKSGTYFSPFFPNVSENDRNLTIAAAISETKTTLTKKSVWPLELLNTGQDFPPEQFQFLHDFLVPDAGLLEA